MIDYADTRNQLRRDITNYPRHQLITAANDFERRLRAAPNDRGIRIVYFELSREIRNRFPITRPTYVEPPATAWTDHAHPYWSTDPETVFAAEYDKLANTIGRINAIITVSEMQQRGQQFPPKNTLT